MSETRAPGTPPTPPPSGVSGTAARSNAATAAAGDDPKVALARERQLWRESNERRSYVRARRIFVLAIVLLIAGASYAAYNYWENGLAVLGIVLLVLLLWVVGAIILWVHEDDLKSAVKDNIRLGIAQELRRQESKLAASGTDFDALWAATQRRIDFYHDIATDQSKKSFRSGQMAAYTGFAVLLIVAGAAVLASNTAAAIAAGTIGVAGAGLSAYIGSTFMKSQMSASEQLRSTFLQPVEFARVLSAERLSTSSSRRIGEKPLSESSSQ